MLYNICSYIHNTEVVPSEENKNEEEEEEKPFNETAYLLGKIPLIQGGEVDPEIIKGNTTTVSNLLSI